MGLNDSTRKNWEEIQKKFDRPVNAIGIAIADSDQATLKVWREEGIDQFVKK